MKKINGSDEKENAMQKRVEQKHPADTKDEIAYAIVFRALQREIEIPLPDSFADRVAFLAKERKAIKTGRSLFDYVLFGVGIVLILIAFIVTIVWTDFTIKWGFLSSLSEYKWMFALGVILVIAFNVIDIRLVKNHRLPM